ncbi:hypothetical protein FB45DRAFT_999014 [Roridomyces roridus]|uniref:Uncharacterized protein n=1 Tax=Roridomyces roridus TaxID=1738132 RepID=A0AAD7CA03_9AGAR|nr:hypothetical protein FB45DRAFT_999014 [Roridomyces roridus]
MAYQQPMVSSRVPEECWYYIVNMLDDTADLNSRASRLAQAVLFHDITIMHRKDAVGLAPGETSLTAEEDIAYTIAAYTRLHDVLLSSPHLTTHIRVVSLSAYVQSVAIVADMDLPRLSDMTLVAPLMTPPKPWNSWAPNTPRQRSALKRLHLQLAREEEDDQEYIDDEDDEDESERSALAWLLHPNSLFVLTGVEELEKSDTALIDSLSGESIENLDLAPLFDLNYLQLYVTRTNDLALLFGPLLSLVATTPNNKIGIISFDIATFSAADLNADVERSWSASTPSSSSYAARERSRRCSS